MVLENLTFNTLNFVYGLSLTEGIDVLRPLVIFIIGMFVYSLFVYKFYKFISSPDIFRVSQGSGDTALHTLAYTFEYLFLFPVIAFFWFFIIAVLLAMLSDVLTIGNVFMIAMATMATIRLTAYYNQELSRDVAKVIPFALLAIFLLDLSVISVSTPITVLATIPAVAGTLAYYFVFIVILEFLLRIVTHGRRVKKAEKEMRRKVEEEVEEKEKKDSLEDKEKGKEKDRRELFRNRFWE